MQVLKMIAVKMHTGGRSMSTWNSLHFTLDRHRLPLIAKLH